MIKYSSGFIAISSVLIILTVVISLALSVSLLSIGEGQGSLARTKGEDTLAFVESCSEDALIKLWANASYAGGNITYPNGTCTVSVSPAGNVYTMTISTSATLYKKAIEIVVTRGTTLIITSWREL